MLPAVAPANRAASAIEGHSNGQAIISAPFADLALPPTTPPKGALSRHGARVSARARTQTGAKKLTPAKRTKVLLDSLLAVMHKEWQSIRTSNLGVLSGTAVVEDLIMRKLQMMAAELHTLCIDYEAAATELARYAQQISKEDLQHLHLMLDVTDHSILADYIRVTVFNTTDPWATKVVDIVTEQDLIGMSALGPASPGHARRRKAVGFNRHGPLPAPAAPPLKRTVRIQQPGFDDLTDLRFAALLPPNHRLVCAAEEIALARTPLPQAVTDRFSFHEKIKPPPDPAEVLEAAAQARLAAYQAAHPRSPTPQYWQTDVENWWRTTISTRQTNDIFNAILVAEPATLYEIPPDCVMQRQQAAAALAAQQAAAHATAAAHAVSALPRLRNATAPAPPRQSNPGGHRALKSMAAGMPMPTTPRSASSQRSDHTAILNGIAEQNIGDIPDTDGDQVAIG